MFHDFYVTIPYGALLVLGGLMGLVLSGSIMSALVGCGIGGALMGLGYMSYEDFRENEKNQFKSANYSYTVVSLILSLIVTLIMGDRYSQSGKLMPSGMVAGISACVVTFYAFRLTTSSDVGAHAKRESKVRD